MAFAAARMIKDKEAKMIAGQKRSTDINQSFSKYNLQKVKEQGQVINGFLALITELPFGRINRWSTPLQLSGGGT